MTPSNSKYYISKKHQFMGTKYLQSYTFTMLESILHHMIHLSRSLYGDTMKIINVEKFIQKLMNQSTNLNVNFFATQPRETQRTIPLR